MYIYFRQIKNYSNPRKKSHMKTRDTMKNVKRPAYDGVIAGRGACAAQPKRPGATRMAAHDAPAIAGAQVFKVSCPGRRWG